MLHNDRFLLLIFPKNGEVKRGVALDSESKIKQLLYLIYVQVENDHNFNYMCFYIIYVDSFAINSSMLHNDRFLFLIFPKNGEVKRGAKFPWILKVKLNNYCI